MPSGKRYTIRAEEEALPLDGDARPEWRGGKTWEQVIALEPRIICPNCRRYVTEIVSGQTNVVTNRMLYKLNCGCEVEALWAGSFTAEMNRRSVGLTPSLPHPLNRQNVSKNNGQGGQYFLMDAIDDVAYPSTYPLPQLGKQTTDAESASLREAAPKPAETALQRYARRPRRITPLKE